MVVCSKQPFRLKSAEFKEVFAEKKVSHNFILFVQRTKQDEKKIGIIASRKVGNAIARNRIKRWIRESFRTNCPQFKPGFKVVIRVREKYHLKNFSQIEKELLDLFKQADLMLPKGPCKNK